jgi:hypothetical protein
MHRNQREFENVPETRQTGPLHTGGVPGDSTMRRGDVYGNQVEYPVREHVRPTARQPGQIYESTNQSDAAMPPHNFVGNAAREQTYDPQNTYGTNTVSGDIDSYGVAPGARHHPFTGAHHHNVVDQSAATVNNGAPTPSFDHHTAHRAGIPAGTGVGGAVDATSGATTTAGVKTGAVEPTTGEKIRGTVRQIVGEMQGSPRKAAEGKALKEGTHPVQTGPYSGYTAGGGPRNI